MDGPAGSITDRLHAQLLGDGALNVVAAVGQLLAVHAQNLDGARLALRARVTKLRPSSIDQALTDRSLVVTWLNRGTLHLVTAADYWWLLPLTAPPAIAVNRRMLNGLGITPDQIDRGLAVIDNALERHGPLRRAELRGHLRSADLPVDGQIGYLLLALSGLLGRTVRGPLMGTEQAYVRIDDWLGPRPPELSRDTALAELGRRYLLGHGPADPADLARWAGISQRDARSALAAPAAADPGDSALRRRALGPIRPKLLGPFDPIMFGWVDRSPLLGRHEGQLITRNGLFRPALLVRERVVGSWRYDHGSVTLLPLEPLSSTELAALERDAVSVAAFLESD